MALHDALAEASYGFRLFGAGHAGLSRRSIGDNRSTISVELLSPIALHDALAEASYGFGCLVLVAVAYRADRLGTIDLPSV
jgi:hypothetical protein